MKATEAQELKLAWDNRAYETIEDIMEHIYSLIKDEASNGKGGIYIPIDETVGPLANIENHTPSVIKALEKQGFTAGYTPSTVRIKDRTLYRSLYIGWDGREKLPPPKALLFIEEPITKEDIEFLENGPEVEPVVEPPTGILSTENTTYTEATREDLEELFRSKTYTPPKKKWWQF